MALKLGIILWTLHLCSHCFRLFWMILLKNTMGRKFHHNYSQSEATNQKYRCNPLWRTQLGSGKVSSSNSSSRTSRTSSSSGSSSSDKTRQGKTTHVFPAILWWYHGDTLKWKKGTPRHQSPSSFQHNHISKFQKGKTQHNPIPNGTDTFRTRFNTSNSEPRTQVKISMFQTMSSKTPAGRSTHRLPEIFHPNWTQQSKWTHWVSKWGVV